MSGKVTVKEVESVDIVPIASWSPSNPGIGDEVNFTVTVSNKEIRTRLIQTEQLQLKLKMKTEVLLRHYQVLFQERLV